MEFKQEAFETVLREALSPMHVEFEAPSVGWAFQQGRNPIGHGSVAVNGQNVKWHWGSCAKAVAGLVVAVLVRRKKVAFDQPIGAMAPSIPKEYSGITLEQLLRHSAGVLEDLPEQELHELVSSDAGRTARESRKIYAEEVFKKLLLHAPGMKYGPYSNAGYSLLSFALETFLDKDWEELVRECVVTPLEMTSVGFGVPMDQALVGHSEEGDPVPDFRDASFQHAPLGLHSTLEEWVLFSRVFRKDPELLEKLGLEVEDVEYLLKPSQHVSAETVGFELPPGYALGWRTAWVDDPNNPSPHDPVVWHLGSNLSWQMGVLILPKHDLSLVVASNSGSMLVRFAMRQALEAILDSLEYQEAK